MLNYKTKQGWRKMNRE